MSDTPSIPQDSTPGPTPGPWTLCHDGDYDEATDRLSHWPWQILGSNDEIIADFTGGSDVTEANARLIAAAPDLLTALKALAEYVADDNPGAVAADAHVALLYENAMAAIAKAETGGAS